MKRAYLCPPITPSRALDRVRNAMCAGPRCGDDFPEEEADVVILQVVGRRDQVLAKAREIWGRGQRTAVIQYVMRSSQKPHTKWWIDLWQGSETVWSYLPLDEWAAEDCYGGSKFDFYHAPLGVDASGFQPRRTSRYTTVLTTGRDWLTESVRECVQAAQEVKRHPRPARHLGPCLNRPSLECYSDLPDGILSSLYSQCHYVSGLRRIEGFELPAAEGLMCGARPILFNREHYKSWYGDWAEYIEEGDRQSVVDQLVELFKRPVRTVTQSERDAAATRFHWPTLVDGFLTRCLA